MVEHEVSNLITGVRFPVAAPHVPSVSGSADLPRTGEGLADEVGSGGAAAA